MCDKTFICTDNGCFMTFTQEDHLSVHQKKHEMVLNLGLIPKANTFAEQTPTPTRFIRNCEEVGLFQDLLNVNPFDEMFKKFTKTNEDSKSPSDDTLHTPRILPHTVTEQITNEPDFDTPDIMGISNSDDEGNLQMDESDLIGPKCKPPPLLYNGRKSQMTNVYSKEIPDKIRRREMNRMAQVRSREKKKLINDQINSEISKLKNDNDKLQLENQQLRIELNRIKTLLNKHKNCDLDVEPVTSKTNGVILPKIQSIGTLKAIVIKPVEINLPTILNQTVKHILPSNLIPVNMNLFNQQFSNRH